MYPSPRTDFTHTRSALIRSFKRQLFYSIASHLAPSQLKIGSACASVLNTHLSREIGGSSKKMRYRYFNLSGPSMEIFPRHLRLPPGPAFFACAASPDQTQLSASAISASKVLADVTGHLEMQVSSLSYPLNGALQPRSHALSPPRLGFSALASSPISAIRP